jgi:hypothetical protein
MSEPAKVTTPTPTVSTPAATPQNVQVPRFDTVTRDIGSLQQTPLVVEKK